MNQEHLLGDPEELAALYSAGALSDADRAGFEAHIAAGCPLCQEQLRIFDPAAALLAQALPPLQPDPRLQARLMERITVHPQEDSASLEETPSRDTQRSPLGRLAVSHADRGAQGRLFFDRAAEAEWAPTLVAGVSMRILHVDGTKDQFMALVRMAAGASYPAHIHNGPESCLVLEGDLHVGSEIMRAGDYQHSPEGSRHEVQRTEHGCLCLIISSLQDEFV